MNVLCAFIFEKCFALGTWAILPLGVTLRGRCDLGEDLDL